MPPDYIVAAQGLSNSISRIRLNGNRFEPDTVQSTIVLRRVKRTPHCVAFNAYPLPTNE